MHPMFVKLFLEDDEEDLPAGGRQRRRLAALVRRRPPRVSRKPTARIKDHQAQRLRLGPPGQLVREGG